MNSTVLAKTHAAPSGYPFAEHSLRRKMGLCRDVMRDLREKKLADGDFIRHKKHVFLTASAVYKLSDGLIAPEPEKSEIVAPAPATAQPERPVRPLVICKTGLTNPRIILACPDTENPRKPKTLFRVRIRPGISLRLWQKIVGRPIPPYTDFYDLVLSRNGREAQTA